MWTVHYSVYNFFSPDIYVPALRNVGNIPITTPAAHTHVHVVCVHRTLLSFNNWNSKNPITALLLLWPSLVAFEVHSACKYSRLAVSEGNHVRGTILKHLSHSSEQPPNQFCYKSPPSTKPGQYLAKRCQIGHVWTRIRLFLINIYHKTCFNRTFNILQNGIVEIMNAEIILWITKN